MAQIIGFSGLAGSGKSTAAKHLVEHHGFTRARFAGPLKAMCRALGLSEREIDGDLKEVPSPLLTHDHFIFLATRAIDAFDAIGIGGTALAYGDPIHQLNGRTGEFAVASFGGVLTQVIAAGEKNGGATPRLLMQMVGTEWGRMLIGPNIWTDLWQHSIRDLDKVVVDDTRFVNEVQLIRSLGGIVVEIKRGGHEIDAKVASHPSEQLSVEPDYLVENIRSIASLGVTLDGLLSYAIDNKTLAA